MRSHWDCSKDVILVHLNPHGSKVKGIEALTDSVAEVLHEALMEAALLLQGPLHVAVAGLHVLAKALLHC